MYFGLSRLPLYPFVGVGFVAVMVIGIALGLVYAVGAAKGRLAAMRYTNVCVYALVALGVVDVVWASLSGQLAPFMSEIGVGPLVEMLVLAGMFIFSMWFMAMRYVQGLRSPAARRDDAND